MTYIGHGKVSVPGYELLSQKIFGYYSTSHITASDTGKQSRQWVSASQPAEHEVKSRELHTKCNTEGLVEVWNSFC